MTMFPLDQTLAQEDRWQQNHQPVDTTGREQAFAALIDDLLRQKPLTGPAYRRVMGRHARRGLPWMSKDQLLRVYRDLCQAGVMTWQPEAITHLQMKPTRTQAGVTTVTVLTKPYPCPGKCIFCPTDVRMPKSYLPDEPGAMRAERHAFDPFAQTAARLEALRNIGHPTQKIELLILGGTWSSYRRDYQEWFVKRCLDALNGQEAESLTQAQQLNARGRCRNVGLVVETRPDHINVEELRWFRFLGVTKVQIGIQSLDDRILALNQRGHDVATTRRAIRLLRLAGYKIHAHWMPNLLGATPDSDIADFARLWDDPAIRPDELKIYPCMLVENAELYAHWQRGEYEPYSEEEALRVLVACKQQVPRWVRINRVVRDIPTTNVVAGMKKANLRQMAQQQMNRMGQPCQCIRCREIRREKVTAAELSLRVDGYETDATTEQFLSFERADGRIAGFLRLSLPRPDAEPPLPELVGHAMIREVHVYGPALLLGESSQGEAQHMGLGRALVETARGMARAQGYSHLAVISAIGTRRYYQRLGFSLEGLYMTTLL
ncbi:MAG: tRNA uridine(34) 5-carboxymethylaminomethyl modification radical SAM/GNAT enzyme Elp3 [Ardenticatenales bacterium]|nr:tRNA uridine(34) 5-carboxymethylaminomethyl modification radical SAM/GNAT enzyme Elp3 [Ardenticatenales bacterium]